MKACFGGPSCVACPQGMPDNPSAPPPPLPLHFLNNHVCVTPPLLRPCSCERGLPGGGGGHCGQGRRPGRGQRHGHGLPARAGEGGRLVGGWGGGGRSCRPEWVNRKIGAERGLQGFAGAGAGKELGEGQEELGKGRRRDKAGGGRAQGSGAGGGLFRPMLPGQPRTATMGTGEGGRESCSKPGLTITTCEGRRGKCTTHVDLNTRSSLPPPSCALPPLLAGRPDLLG